MGGRPKVEERYEKGNEVINFVIYQSTTGSGDDQVLQHKLVTTETAHVTLHPDGKVNVRRQALGDARLKQAIRGKLRGYHPVPSRNVLQFLERIKSEI